MVSKTTHSPFDLTRRKALLALSAGMGSAAWIGQAYASRGFEAVALNRIVDRARSFDQMHALVLARNGDVHVAERWRGPSLEQPVNVKSVSKTIVASMAGAAIDRDLIDGVDVRLAEIIPDLLPKQADPRVGDIRLSDLLTMQAGLERTSGRFYGRWVNSDNWVRYALSRPFVAEPGSRMLYSTGSYHLLGVALARAGGADLVSLARAWLGQDLKIGFQPWNRDPQGYYMGGNNMVLSPMELLRFGEMWRLGGRWNDRSVLSDQWTKRSWQPRTHSPFSGDDYGYGWFLTRLRGHDVAYARGYGGQMLYVVPSLGVTMVVLSDPTRPARSHGYAGDLKMLLEHGVIPAAEKA